MRQDRHGPALHLDGKEAEKEEDGKKRVVHVVSVERLEPEGDRRTNYGRHFDNLEDALRYANGEDRSALSRYSHALDGRSSTRWGWSTSGTNQPPPYSP